MPKHKAPITFFGTLISITGRSAVFFASLQARFIMAESRWKRRLDGKR